MATLSYTAVTHLGATPTLSAAAGGGDEIAPHPAGVVIVKNGDATSTVVTVTVPGTEYGVARPDYTYTVTAGATAYLGPFPADLKDASDGRVNLSYDKVTSLTVGAIALG